MPTNPFSRSSSLSRPFSRRGSATTTASDLEKRLSKHTKVQLKAEVTQLGGDVRGLNTKLQLLREIVRLEGARRRMGSVVSAIESEDGDGGSFAPARSPVKKPGFELLNHESPNMGQSAGGVDEEDEGGVEDLSYDEELADDTIDEEVEDEDVADIAASAANQDEGSGWPSSALDALTLYLSSHPYRDPIIWGGLCVLLLQLVLLLATSCSPDPKVPSVKVDWVYSTSTPVHITSEAGVVHAYDRDSDSGGGKLDSDIGGVWELDGCKEQGRVFLSSRKFGRKRNVVTGIVYGRPMEEEGTWVEGVLYCPDYPAGSSLSAGLLSRQGFEVNIEDGGYRIAEGDGSGAGLVGVATLRDGENWYALGLWTMTRTDVYRTLSFSERFMRYGRWMWSR